MPKAFLLERRADSSGIEEIAKGISSGSREISYIENNRQSA